MTGYGAKKVKHLLDKREFPVANGEPLEGLCGALYEMDWPLYRALKSLCPACVKAYLQDAKKV